MRARTWGFVVIAVSVAACGHGQPGIRPTALDQWNTATLQGTRYAKLGAPALARALAIVHTCIYDAWAAYDERAVGTQLAGALRRPTPERTLANKQKAISYAAYRALVDLLPADTDSVYIPLMKRLGYDPNDNSTDIETPAGIGNVACAAVLEFRHHDKSNQLGDLALGPYSDWTGYRPVNAPGMVPPRAALLKPLNPEHWQPLTYTDASGNLVVQMFEGAHWGCVEGFAIGGNVACPCATEAGLGKGASGAFAEPEGRRGSCPYTGREEFRKTSEPGPPKFFTPEYEAQAKELVELSAGLTDRQKMIAEYWAAGSDGDAATERWMQLAEFISERDQHTLDDDVKMFFALSNAMLDATIAAGDAKRVYDSVRPATAIPLLFRGKKIRSWGGPGKGAVEMDGSQWIPYQPATFPTPPSPEYVSGRSTLSAAAARILELWTGSDQLGYRVTLAAGSSKTEPAVTPSHPVDLRWETFTDAANDAGLSSLYGGIGFRNSNAAGRTLGTLVAEKVWKKAQQEFNAATLH